MTGSCKGPIVCCRRCWATINSAGSCFDNFLRGFHTQEHHFHRSRFLQNSTPRFVHAHVALSNELTCHRNIATRPEVKVHEAGGTVVVVVVSFHEEKNSLAVRKTMLRDIDILPAKTMDPVDVMWLKTNRGVRGFPHFHFQLYLHILIVAVKHGTLSCSTKAA